MRPVNFDEEVERRLRAIGTGPMPPMPGSITDYLHRLPAEHRAPARQDPWRGAGRLSFARLALGGLMAVAIVVGVAAGTLLMQHRQGGGSGSSASPATPGCTRPPMRNAAAAELVKSGAVIVYERSGGVTCESALHAIYADGRVVSGDGNPTSQWPVDKVTTLLDKITTIPDAAHGWFSGYWASTDHEPCKACYEYSITITDKGQTKTVNAVDGGTDAPAGYWIVTGYLAEALATLETGCTNSPMRSAAAAELARGGAVIVWERNGGPGCVDELYAAYPDGRTVSDRGGAPTNGQVTSARVQAVMGQITDAGFFTDLFFTTYHPPCSVCHQHSVTVTYGSQTKTVGSVEGGTDGPAEYWIVIGYLSDLFGVAS